MFGLQPHSCQEYEKSSSISRLFAVFTPSHVTVLRFARETSACSYELQIMDGEVLEAVVVAGQGRLSYSKSVSQAFSVNL